MRRPELILKLQSPHHSIRAEATKELFECRDINLLKIIHEYVFDNPEDDLGLLFINVLNDLISEISEQITPWALKALLEFQKDPDTILAKNSMRFIVGFFKNNEIFNHFKSYCLNQIWKQLSTESRLILTQIIRQHKFPNLSNLLLENFLRNDKNLSLETLKTFRELKDRRANKFIKVFFDSKDKELILEAIKSSGTTGNFLDSRLIKPLIINSDIDIAKESIFAYRSLLNTYALNYLIECYNKMNSLVLKREIVFQISFISSVKALNFLLKCYQLEFHHELRLDIEQAIIKISIKSKDVHVVDFILQSNDTAFVRNMHLLEHFRSEVISDFLISTASGSDNDLSRIMAIDLLSSYDKAEVLTLLRQLYEKYDSMFSPYAFDSLLKNIFVFNRAALIEWMPLHLNLEYVHHSIFIKYITKLEVSPDDRSVYSDYLIDILRSKSEDNFYTAISALKFVHNQKAILVLLDEYNKLGEKFYQRDAILSTVRTIMYKSSKHIQYQILELIPLELFKYLNPILIKPALLRTILLFLSKHKHTILSHFIKKNLEMLREKTSIILLNEEDEFALTDIFIFVKTLGMQITFEAEERVKMISKKNITIRPHALIYFMNKNNQNDFDFIIYYYKECLQYELQENLNDYLEHIL